MIPSEVAAIADILAPDWPTMTDEDSNFWIGLAWKIHNAGYRKQENP